MMSRLLLFMCAVAAMVASAATPFWEDPPTNRPPACAVQAAMSMAFDSRVNVSVRVDGINIDSTPRGCMIIFW